MARPVTGEHVGHLVALLRRFDRSLAHNVATGGWDRSTRVTMTAEEGDVLRAVIEAHGGEAHAVMPHAPFPFERLWPGPRSRCTHLFLRGPGQGDTSLCGRATMTGVPIDVLDNDPECAACNRIAEREAVLT